MTMPCNCCPVPPDGCFGENGDPAQPVFPMRCPSGTSTVTRWFRPDGTEAAQGDVRPCGTASENIPVQLTATGTFFGDEPGGNGENLCAFTTPPDVLSGFTAVAGGCYDPTVGSPSMQWTTPITSLTFQYGNPPAFSGGAYLTFTSPDLGTVTWPNTGQLAPGQTLLSNPLTAGRRVLLTYASGPLGTAPSGSVQIEAGSRVWFHRNSTSTTAAPIRIRLDFISA